MEPRLKV